MKHFELSEENQKLIDDLFQEADLAHYMQLRTIGIAKSKEMIKVARPSDVVKYIGHLPDDVVTIVLYEEAFDRLDEANKRLIIEDALATISYDNEKDKISIGVPMITATVGGRQKYGERLINAAELATTMIQELEEEKKAQKEAEKAAKASKKKND